MFGEEKDRFRVVCTGDSFDSDFKGTLVVPCGCLSGDEDGAGFASFRESIPNRKENEIITWLYNLLSLKTMFVTKLNVSTTFMVKISPANNTAPG